MLFAVFLIIGVAFRTALVLREPYRCVDSDEAISGIMAMHILEGRELPLVYYGQPHGGAGSSYITAILFAITGPSAVALKMVAMGFFALFVLAFYLLARQEAGVPAALIGTGYLSFPPAYFTDHSIMADGLYAPMFFLGTLLFYLAGRWIREEGSWRLAGIIGLVAGLALWTHLLAILYVVPAVIVMAIRARSRMMRTLPPLVGGTLIGAFPLILYNLMHRGETAGFLAGNVGAGSMITRLREAITAEMPTIIGMRDIAEPFGPNPWFAWPVAAIWIGVLGIYVVRGLRKDDIRIGAVFLLCVPVIVALSGFRSFALHPRYLSPCYAILPLALGATAVWAWSRARPVVMVSLGLIALLHVWGNGGIWETGLLWEKWRPGNRWVQRDQDHADLIRYLETNGVHHVFTNYWIGYRLHLESGGRIIPSPYLTHAGPELPCEERYPPFTQEVRSRPTASYLFWEEQYPERNVVHSHVGSSRRRFIGPFVLWTGIPNPAAATVPGSLLRDKSDLRFRLPPGPSEGRGALADGDFETVWRSLALQQPGMTLDIVLPEAIPVHGLDIAFRGQEPVPHGYRILSSPDGESFQVERVFGRGGDVIPLVNAHPIRVRPYRLILPLRGSTARAIRLEIVDPAPWTFEIAEIDLHVGSVP
jgi:hypothetical protein